MCIFVNILIYLMRLCCISRVNSAPFKNYILRPTGSITYIIQHKLIHSINRMCLLSGLVLDVLQDLRLDPVAVMGLVAAAAGLETEG